MPFLNKKKQKVSKMKKKEFINELRKELKGIDKDELDDILADYEDHIMIGLKKKRKEADIIKALGEPAAIAKQVKADFHIKKAETKFSASNIFRYFPAMYFVTPRISTAFLSEIQNGSSPWISCSS